MCSYSTSNLLRATRLYVNLNHLAEVFMKSNLLLRLCVIGVTFAATLNVLAQDASVPPDVKAFAAQYVAAFNAKDKAGIAVLYLPESRACITPANHDVYDDILRMQMRDHIPPDYFLTFTAVNENNLKAAATLASYAVKPERELHIDYQYPGTNDGGQSFLALVRRNGRWMADSPCMTPQAIKDFRDSAADREHYRATAAAIKEPLRSQLLAMVRAHQDGEAATRYQQVAGGDMSTAMAVINGLKDQLR